MIDYDRCPCGSPDCPSCHPELQATVRCEACGMLTQKHAMHDEAICDRCHEEGYGVCSACGEIETLVDGKQCSECWVEELREACAC